VEDESKGKHYYDLLDRVSTVFSCPHERRDQRPDGGLAQKLSPILTKHSNDVMLNPASSSG
jgi:peptidyl-dipeptidase Dcp